MTHPTKSIYNYVLQDFVKVSGTPADEQLFDERDIENTLAKIRTIDYHQTVDFNGVKFTAYRAGHVLGAAMFLLEIDGLRLLYTGDYSREEDRHLKPAEVPDCEIDVLIVESTYGVQKHDSRETRENTFTKYVSEIVLRGGKCLMPVFALGRAQEILLILNEYWALHPELAHVPIYYQGNLANRALSVFNTHRNMMGDKLRRELEAGQNPFRFQHYDKLDSIADAATPLVIMASPGMLQNGPSRELFVKWAPEKRNGIVFTGYSVEGTLAKKVIDSHKTIPVGEQIVQREMSVEYISFSAHADFAHTHEYVEILQPPNIVLVHGDSNEMSKLRNALTHIYKERIQILCPRNCQKVRFNLVSKKSAKIIGTLAHQVIRETTQLRDQLANQLQKFSPQSHQAIPQSFPAVKANNDSSLMHDANDAEIDLKHLAKQEQHVQTHEGEPGKDVQMFDCDDTFVHLDGVLVKQNFEQLIMSPNDVVNYTALKSLTMQQTLHVPFEYDAQVLAYFLYDYFNDVQASFPQQLEADSTAGKSQDAGDQNDITGSGALVRVIFEIQGCVTVKYLPKVELLEISWCSSPSSDLVADSLCLLALQIKDQPTPQLVRLMEATAQRRRDEDFRIKLGLILGQHFEKVEVLPPSAESGLSLSLPAASTKALSPSDGMLIITDRGKTVAVDAQERRVVRSECEKMK